MAARDDTNIQRLLAAEKAAQEIVDKARKERAEKMKLAKLEAENEIAEYRAERQAEYDAKVATSSSASGTTFKKLDDDTQAAIDAITRNLPSKKKDAVAMLVSHVTNVDLSA
eukprot:g1941.t1